MVPSNNHYIVGTHPPLLLRGRGGRGEGGGAEGGGTVQDFSHKEGGVGKIGGLFKKRGGHLFPY